MTALSQVPPIVAAAAAVDSIDAFCQVGVSVPFLLKVTVEKAELHQQLSHLRKLLSR
jgi:hypothetical protein